MVDVLLLITTLVVAAILLAISFYVLVVFVHRKINSYLS